MSKRGPYRRHTAAFKLQLCADIRSGTITRSDARRQHSLSANLLQLWLTQFDRGEIYDEGVPLRHWCSTKPRSQLWSARSGS